MREMSWWDRKPTILRKRLASIRNHLTNCRTSDGPMMVSVPSKTIPALHCQKYHNIHGRTNRRTDSRTVGHTLYTEKRGSNQNTKFHPPPYLPRSSYHFLYFRQLQFDLLMEILPDALLSTYPFFLTSTNRSLFESEIEIFYISEK